MDKRSVNVLENYEKIFKAESENERIVLRRGNAVKFKTSVESADQKRYRLFFTGGTNIYYTWKCENDCRVSYSKIDDSLSTEEAYRSHYCVKLEGKAYPKILYKKVMSEYDSYFCPVLSYLNLDHFTEAWTCGVFAKGENIKINEGGRLFMRFEIRCAREGVSRHDVRTPADFTYLINFPEGSYDWQELSQSIRVPHNTVSVAVFVYAENYEGTLYLEAPYFTSSNGFNILPDFSVSTEQRAEYNWLGQNLSKKEWPEFSLSVNGEEFFSGELFERCHINSECEINIPDGLIKEGENELEIRLVSDFRDAPSYLIDEVALISEPRNSFNIVAFPEAVTVGIPFALLLQVNEPSELGFKGEGVRLCEDEKLSFEKSGLYAVRFTANEPAVNMKITLKNAEHTEECVIERGIVRVEEDNVISGTGDLVYVKQDIADTENFIRFYMSHRIGNLITVRPVYRWSGTRTYNPELFESFVPLMNKLGMKYSNMTDGRELPGQCANPPRQVMEKTYDGIPSGFVGRQKHEQDGAYNYWMYYGFSGDYCTELWYDLSMRNFEENIETTTHFEQTPDEVFYLGDSLSRFRYPGMPDDMKEMHDYVVESLDKNRYDNTRHTGPSVMFKYFYEAGYDWVGAELMYGALEPVVAFMRGANRGYNKTNGMGAHLAVQWSSTPHDVPEKTRRFRLALYLSYMHGITEINTEEGLWHVEEYYSAFNRFSDTCRDWTRQQQDFFRYTQTHTRSGEFYAPFGFIHGRYDGSSFFSRDRVWGRSDFKASGAEDSWALVNNFYPLSKLDGIYCHFDEGTKPLGFYTGTPRGNTDIIPIEKGGFERYKVLSFAGYNRAEAEDFDRLYGYVKNGGSLIMGWPHAAVTTERRAVENGEFEYIDHPLIRELFSAIEYKADTVNGKTVTVCTGAVADELIALTDSGEPLAFKRNIGKGEVYFVNAEQYPSDSTLRPIYDSIIKRLSDELNAKEKAFMRVDEKVGFTVYDQADGSRHIYVIAVDWYNDPETVRHSTLLLSGREYPVDITFGTMLKLVAEEDIAVWSDDETVEVLEVGSEGFTVQGAGVTTVKVAREGVLCERVLDFTEKPILKITL